MTRDQHRVILAWLRLDPRLGRPRDIGPWLERRGMPPAVVDLTRSQARVARRELNAWRVGVTGYVTTVQRYPRKERRNAARRAAIRERASREAFRVVNP